MFLYIVCTKVLLVYLQASELTLIPEKLNRTFATVDLFQQQINGETSQIHTRLDSRIHLSRLVRIQL